ncbi:cupin domain-containing protein [Nocardia transvalensis]|uniref:cupin domain-containing protein n=1 Tax=Nocardia transvalensis TaxID=37333 RepID=UPI0018955CF4|nr:cupin domain-containing protein [Nocardia transvalensis]MBF6331003.1 cupin domain-containing protein [Nocardia transvalensis]
MTLTPAAESIIEQLRLEPLSVCNGFFRETWRDEHSTVIHWLLPDTHTAPLHTADHTEVFAYHAGAPLRFTLFHPVGRVEEVLLGPDPATQFPHLVVPAGVWQAARTTGEYTLASVVVAPPFRPEIVHEADPYLLSRQFPDHRELIRELCGNGEGPDTADHG